MAIKYVPKILCVEDDDDIRSNAVEALQDAGFDVLEAQNGEEAIALIANPDSVDAIFTDVVMPGNWDGVDLVQRVRIDHPKMPVVVTSGYAAKLGARLEKLSPPTIFIHKPYRLSEVVNTLERLTLGMSKSGNQ